MRALFPLLGLAALGVGYTCSASALEERMAVDVNLITALDTSFSIGPDEERLQREGLARAVLDPRFLDLIRTGLHRRVAFAIFTWSSHGNIKPIVPWSLIATTTDAARLSKRLLTLNLLREGQGLDPDIPTDHYEAPATDHLTDIGGAIRFGSAELRSAPFESRRSVINIVGNGPSNSGVEPARARDGALGEGQVINGLLVGPDTYGLLDYYRSQVIGGAGSFVMQVSNLDNLSEAFAEKLKMDIAGVPSLGASYVFVPFEKTLQAE